MSHAVIVCEGYQDRQFISEWLDRRGMRKAEPRAISFRETYEKVNDRGLRISIVAAMGKEKVLPVLAKFIELNSSPIAAWLVVTDTDGIEPNESAQRLRQAIAQKFPAGPAIEIAQWHPILEGVIDGAIGVAYPARLKHVTEFLESRPDAPQRSGKEASRTYCSAWETQFFGEAFYARVLKDDQLRPLIEAKLPEFAKRIEALLAIP